jgi:hypothetical protein
MDFVLLLGKIVDELKIIEGHLKRCDLLEHRFFTHFLPGLEGLVADLQDFHPPEGEVLLEFPASKFLSKSAAAFVVHDC